MNTLMVESNMNPWIFNTWFSKSITSCKANCAAVLPNYYENSYIILVSHKQEKDFISSQKNQTELLRFSEENGWVHVWRKLKSYFFAI